MCIAPLALSTRRGQQAPLALPLKLGHQRLGQRAGHPPQAVSTRRSPDGPRPSSASTGEARPGPHRLARGGPPDPARREWEEARNPIPPFRARIARAARASGPGAGALQLLRLDPELGGIHAERRAAPAPARASSALATLERIRATRAWALARPRAVVRSSSANRLLEHEESKGRAASSRAVSAAAPSRAAGCRGRGRPAGARPIGRWPAFSNPPVRETDHPRF